MKKITTKYALYALAIVSVCLAACNKKKDNELLTNIPAERKDVSQAQVLNESNITGNVTLADRVNGVDYVIPSTLTVTSGTLNIQPGVTIMFEDGAGVLVKEEGSITAIGEEGNTILFTSRSGKRGSWTGITVLSNTTRNVLSYCTIEQAGAETNYGKADVVIGAGNNAASITINHSTIATSDGDGIWLSKGSQLKNFEANTFATNTGYPISMYLSGLATLQSGNTYTNNGKQYIQLLGNSDPELNSINFRKMELPYCFSGSFITSGDITINKGCMLYMNEGASWIYDGVETNGTFTAVGTESEPITITGVYSPSGFWNSLSFKSNGSQACTLENCLLIGGGVGSEGKGIVNIMNNTGNVQLSITKCKFMNSGSNGIFIQHAGAGYNADLATTNTFSGITGQNIRFENQ